jgi:hypothetical protein
MSAASHSFDHRVDFSLGTIIDVPPRGETRPVMAFKTDKGRVIRVVRVAAAHATFDVIDDVSGKRARLDCVGLFERVASDLLDAVGAGDTDATADNLPQSENPAPREAL